VDLYLSLSIYLSIARSTDPSETINQSKVLTKPHTGKEKPHPSTTTEGSKPFTKTAGQVLYQSINQRSSQSHTRARRSHILAQPQRAANPLPRPRSRCCINQSIKGPHKATHGQGEATSQHYTTEGSKPFTKAAGQVLYQSINQRSSQSHTRARRSHIPAPPQRAANPLPRPRGRCCINQSIKGPHKATHGQGEATS